MPDAITISKHQADLENNDRIGKGAAIHRNGALF
jgi:hypothetical protein